MKKTLRRFLQVLLVLLLLLVAGLVLLFTVTTRVTKQTDNYVYELPFKPGASFRVVQGYGGLFSHRYAAAIDFAMPEGTPIYAAREGEILGYKDNSNEGGPWASDKRKANYLMIRHPDGSIGCYWHLQYKGVVVKQGTVQRGQLIGYSGATGLVLRPHLHFSVKKRLGYHMDDFVRTRFRTEKGVMELQKGNRYTRPAQP